jgi:hypothetical protein
MGNQTPGNRRSRRPVHHSGSMTPRHMPSAYLNHPKEAALPVFQNQRHSLRDSDNVHPSGAQSHREKRSSGLYPSDQDASSHNAYPQQGYYENHQFQGYQYPPPYGMHPSQSFADRSAQGYHGPPQGSHQFPPYGPNKASQGYGYQSFENNQTSSRDSSSQYHSSSASSSGALDKYNTLRRKLGRDRQKSKTPTSSSTRQYQSTLALVPEYYEFKEEEEYGSQKSHSTSENDALSIVPVDSHPDDSYLNQQILALDLSDDQKRKAKNYESYSDTSLTRSSHLSRGSHREEKISRSQQYPQMEAKVHQDPISPIWSSMKPEKKMELLEIINKRRGILYLEAYFVLEQKMTKDLVKALRSQKTPTVDLAVQDLFGNEGGPPAWMGNALDRKARLSDTEADELVESLRTSTGFEKDGIRRLFVEIGLTYDEARRLLQGSDRDVEQLAQYRIPTLYRLTRVKQVGEPEEYPWEKGLDNEDKDAVVRLVMVYCNVDVKEAHSKLENERIEEKFGIALLGSTPTDFHRFVEFMNTGIFPAESRTIWEGEEYSNRKRGENKK